MPYLTKELLYIVPGTWHAVRELPYLALKSLAWDGNFEMGRRKEFPESKQDGCLQPRGTARAFFSPRQQKQKGASGPGCVGVAAMFSRVCGSEKTTQDLFNC